MQQTLRVTQPGGLPTGVVERHDRAAPAIIIDHSLRKASAGVLREMTFRQKTWAASFCDI
jgi:hypothetical protein